jgi:hypothetical protein
MLTETEGAAMRHHLTAIALALIAPVLGGCEAAVAGADQIAECEAFLQRGLLAPSTYKRIGASVTDSELLPPAQFAREVTQSNLPAEPAHLRVVGLTYDADNSFGAPLRDIYVCQFRISAAARAAEDPKPVLVTTAQARAGEDPAEPSLPVRAPCCVPDVTAP